MTQTQRLIPTEICERIIDFVALQYDATKQYRSTVRVWDIEVYATLKACSLTCRAWRSRSQWNLLRIAGVRASISGPRSFNELSRLFRRAPSLTSEVEMICVDGRDLELPRFHLVSMTIPYILPAISSLTLIGGLVYFPTASLVSMRRFTHLKDLCLQDLVFFTAGDLRRTLNALRSLENLLIIKPSWHTLDGEHKHLTKRWPRSRVGLKRLEIFAESGWIANVNTILFLDWLCGSGAVSAIEQLELGNMMILDDNIANAVKALLYAIQGSPMLTSVSLSFGPNVEMSALCPALSSLPRLNGLYLTCPYDKQILLQLVNLLRTILSRPEHSMHRKVQLVFDRYPHLRKPPADLWTSLDDVLQQPGLKEVCVDCCVRQVDQKEPVDWGNWHACETEEGWVARVRKLLPET